MARKLETEQRWHALRGGTVAGGDFESLDAAYDYSVAQYPAEIYGEQTWHFIEVTVVTSESEVDDEPAPADPPADNESSAPAADNGADDSAPSD